MNIILLAKQEIEQIMVYIYGHKAFRCSADLMKWLGLCNCSQHTVSHIVLPLKSGKGSEALNSCSTGNRIIH